MTFPTVTEIPPRPEPLTADSFAIVIPADRRRAPAVVVRRRTVD